MLDTSRDETLRRWLSQEMPLTDGQLHLLAGDASFRRYYRYANQAQSYVVMDAPPELENSHHFEAVASDLAAIGLHVPDIKAYNREQGFLVLSDFGDMLLLDALNAQSADSFYAQALSILLQLQAPSTLPTVVLPHFDDKFITMELSRLEKWYIDKLLSHPLTNADFSAYQSLCQEILQVCADQTQVIIHRDFHSRNLMVTADGLGVLDFQDAMLGPISYDVVSLLKDCYIDWPREKVIQWLADYYQKARAQGQTSATFADFTYQFDITGVQRHLKCLGIFARLALRDNKPSYLNYLPRVWGYVDEVIRLYPHLHPYADFVAAIKPVELSL